MFRIILRSKKQCLPITSDFLQMILGLEGRKLDHKRCHWMLYKRETLKMQDILQVKHKYSNFRHMFCSLLPKLNDPSYPHRCALNSLQEITPQLLHKTLWNLHYQTGASKNLKKNCMQNTSAIFNHASASSCVIKMQVPTVWGATFALI